MRRKRIEPMRRITLFTFLFFFVVVVERDETRIRRKPSVRWAMGRKRLSSGDSTLTTSSCSPSKLLNCTTGGGMQQRNAANARERARMRVLSKAFIKLKTHLPWVPHDTKLSKLDTLRLATSYILHLTEILETDELTLPVSQPSLALTSSNTSIQAPNNFSWPYSSCHRSSSLCSLNNRFSLSSSNQFVHPATEYSTVDYGDYPPHSSDLLPDDKTRLS